MTAQSGENGLPTEREYLEGLRYEDRHPTEPEMMLERRVTESEDSVIRMLRRGYKWPQHERADGCRYWVLMDPPRWEPVSDAEREVIERIEREDGEDTSWHKREATHG